MSDLIRRIDAVQACQVGPSDEWSRSTKSGYNQAATDCAMNILRIAPALPAVQHDALTADRIEQLTAERDRLRRALHYYADFHSAPSDGPWGVNSDDFGAEARAALKGDTL